MLKNFTALTAASAFVLSATVLACGPTAAQGYDTSSIPVDEDLAARVPERIREAGVLVGGSDNDYAPWEYLAGEDGQTPEGIDIDIGNAIAATLGLDYESRTALFTTILPALGTNYDIGLSAFSITDERLEVVNFVSYNETGNEWVIRAGNPDGFDPNDICGRVIAMQSGSSHEELMQEESQRCVSEGMPEIEILPFRTQTEAVTRVAAGGAAATLTGSTTALYAAFRSNGTLETVEPVGDILNFRSPNGIAIAKSDMDLTQLIADTLNHLIENGTYAAILDAWGMSVVGIEEAQINPAGF
ncbi:MAG: ABC transporter substrate-binding protein [Rhodospirillaceae bacterium]|nr:ABC transporter substrate-binding protein [Rhodospirillaceae bacterium]